MADKENQELAVVENKFLLPTDGISVDTEELEGMNLTFDKVSIPSGGSTQWETVDENGEVLYLKEIEGVIVDHYPVNAYFENEYTGEIVPPTCCSLDGKLGAGDPGGECVNCPLNKYGSADDGKGKKCKNLRRLYILRSGEVLPILITLPPTSIKNFSDYVSKRIVTKGMKTCDVITKLALIVEKSSTGIKYSKVTFSIANKLNDAERTGVRKYSEDIKNLTRMQRLEIAQEDIVEVKE